MQHLIDALQSTSPPTRDPSGGCFCQARRHPLSPYTPLCFSCGLVLCALNKPHHLCPSPTCPSPNLLSTPQHRADLLAHLRHQLATELQKQENLKLKLDEEKKKQAGAFPSLPSTSTPKPIAPKTHKVLSITQSKKKKQIVTISSPSSSVPPSRTESPSLSEGRVPPPPNKVIHALPPPSSVLESRPWRNFTLDHDIRYIPVNK
ncbi:hypothetical protein AGABI1DRAFT_126595 [Agaricus bisporus var. burnettii JB137-S8]|uniref:TRIP4/RQT4 C2HC5-type zinc finger domain-containing protein n=1 Tax=Agaricus bisporus var. burnettii (strain JB137-S8 / ATCC MYA-4627 / FGSC 10392) TaxID=597362 RepID=K5Y2Y5_AGABU|nr:uncharacterized protein AGABI1DRAFT_126595 [Agaricus bisporus var. burnettii JB137-S8]EKM82265.1 hypothetical protein AGABI1DRAFT_126595 [Agaricus bisporus var. burnettii JB137-S8]